MRKAIIVMMLLAVVTGCNHRGSEESVARPAVKVRIQTVEGLKTAGILSYVGTIEEKSSTALSFSTLGMIEKFFVSEGDYVSRGQLLARLDDASAQSMLVAAEATLKQAQDGYDRLKSVHDEGSLPEIQMVDIETKLQQAQSSYNIAKNNLKNCSLYAPVSGVIGKKMAEAGEYAVVGKAVLTILDIGMVKVRFSVPENEISAIPSDCRSSITVSALGNQRFEGQKIEKSVSSNPISHTYPAHLLLSNAQKELLPGMVCNVELYPDSQMREAIVIPIGIIQTMADGQKFVWCDRGGVARRVVVTTGTVRDNGVEITGGLSVGDRIVTEGYQKLSEDDKIIGQ